MKKHVIISIIVTIIVAILSCNKIAGHEDARCKVKYVLTIINSSTVTCSVQVKSDFWTLIQNNDTTYGNNISNSLEVDSLRSVNDTLDWDWTQTDYCSIWPGAKRSQYRVEVNSRFISDTFGMDTTMYVFPTTLPVSQDTMIRFPSQNCPCEMIIVDTLRI